MPEPSETSRPGGARPSLPERVWIWWERGAHTETSGTDGVWPLIVVLATMVVSNIMANMVEVAWFYVPWNITMAVIVTTVALQWDGLRTADLGMATRRIPDGLRLGGAFSGILLAVYTVGVLIPATRDLFRDERADVGVAALLHRVLIAVPFGTVLFEEIAFRGVLPAMFGKRLRRFRYPKLKADVFAALLFGLWHILPSWNLDESNPIFKDFLPVGFSQFFAVAGGVLATAVFGMFFSWMRNRSDSLAAPMLLHLTSNSVGYLLAWLAQNW